MIFNVNCLFMKFKLFFAFIIIFINYCFSQEDVPNVQQIIQVPNSPEATAFIKYGNTPVSLYTGTPNISIPIYTIKGKEIQMPISLNYDASGIKVKQLATNVGLGWNLNVGGAITRRVVGLPDDRFFSRPFYKTHYDPSIENIIQAGLLPPLNAELGILNTFIVEIMAATPRLEVRPI